MNFTKILRPIEIELWNRVNGVDKNKLSKSEAEDLADLIHAHIHIMEVMETLHRFDSKLEGQE